jgi:hypothetical protein
MEEHLWTQSVNCVPSERLPARNSLEEDAARLRGVAFCFLGSRADPPTANASLKREFHYFSEHLK